MVEDAISFWTDIQRYEDKLVADPHSLCFVELSELYRKLGLLDDAVSVAKKGSDLHPDYPVGFYVLGAACYAKGLAADARQALERTLELQSEHLEASRLLAQLYVESGELAQAEKLLSAILLRHPDDVESELLLRSVGAPRAAEPEEELEELEVIEDLTEVLDEVEEPETPASFGVPEAAARAGWEEEAAGPSPESAPFAALEDDSDLWAFQAHAELKGAGEPVPLEAPLEFAGFDAAAPEPPAPFEPEEFADLNAQLPAVEFPVPPLKGGVEGFPELPDLSDVDLSDADFSETDFSEVDRSGLSGPAPAAPPAARDPLTTATLAELYVTQGFLDKAITIYRELLGTDPGNQIYRSRCAELEQMKALQAAAPEAAPLAAPVPPARAGASQPAPAGLEAELCNWLENIRRRRDGV